MAGLHAHAHVVRVNNSISLFWKIMVPFLYTLTHTYKQKQLCVKVPVVLTFSHNLLIANNCSSHVPTLNSITSL